MRKGVTDLDHSSAQATADQVNPRGAEGSGSFSFSATLRLVSVRTRCAPGRSQSRAPGFLVSDVVPTTRRIFPSPTSISTGYSQPTLDIDLHQRSNAECPSGARGKRRGQRLRGCERRAAWFRHAARRVRTLFVVLPRSRLCAIA
jgi:hypothetical protein